VLGCGRGLGAVPAGGWPIRACGGGAEMAAAVRSCVLLVRSVVAER
jgi:hypothetical protein